MVFGLTSSVITGVYEIVEHEDRSIISSAADPVHARETCLFTVLGFYWVGIGCDRSCSFTMPGMFIIFSLRCHFAVPVDLDDLSG